MGIFNYQCASSVYFLVFIGFPSGYYVLLFSIIVFCDISLLYELLYICYWTSGSIFYLHRKVSVTIRAHVFRNLIFQGQNLFFVFKPF